MIRPDAALHHARACAARRQAEIALQVDPHAPSAQSSSFIRSSRPSRVTPALATRMSTGAPAAASAAPTRPSTAAASARSQATTRGALAQLGRPARSAPPRAVPDSTTCAPWACRARAIAAADAAGGAGDQGGLAGKGRTSSGSCLKETLAKASRSAGAFSARRLGVRRDALGHAGQHLAGARPRRSGSTPPSPASHAMLSRQRTRPVTCSTSSRRIASGSSVGRAVTLATSGARGARDRRPRPGPRPSRRRPAASAGSGRAPRRSAGWPARPAPWPSRWPGRPPPCRRRSPHCRRCCRWRRRRRRPPSPAAAASSARATSLLGPISEAMAPSPTGTARCMAWPRSLQQPRGVGQADRAGGGQGRIFAQASGRRRRPPRRSPTPNSALQRAHHRQAHRHQRRLGVLGQGQCPRSAPRASAGTASGPARRPPPRTPRGRRRRPRPARRPCRRPGCPGRERGRRGRT